MVDKNSKIGKDLVACIPQHIDGKSSKVVFPIVD